MEQLAISKEQLAISNDQLAISKKELLQEQNTYRANEANFNNKLEINKNDLKVANAKIHNLENSNN